MTSTCWTRPTPLSKTVSVTSKRTLRIRMPSTKVLTRKGTKKAKKKKKKKKKNTKKRISKAKRKEKDLIEVEMPRNGKFPNLLVEKLHLYT